MAGFFLTRACWLQTPDTMDIRPADRNDFAALCELYAHLSPDDSPATEALRQQTFHEMLQHPGLTILVAAEQQTLLATLTLVVVPNLTRGCAPYALIENVVTRRTRRGEGIGRRLMQAATERAFSSGCFKVMLLSGTGNRDAHRFYESLGFETTKTGFERRAPGYPARKLS